MDDLITREWGKPNRKKWINNINSSQEKKEKEMARKTLEKVLILMYKKMQSKIILWCKMFGNTVEKQAVWCIAGRSIKWYKLYNRDLGKKGRLTFGPVISLLGIYSEDRLPQISNTCIRLFIATLFVTVEIGEDPNAYQ